MNKYFNIERSPFKEDKFVIHLNFDEFPSMTTTGSYAILEARLMGLTYANYLRMCRDCFGAEIIGKNYMYPVVYFSDELSAKQLVRVLNKRMELVMTLKKGVPDEFQEEWQKEYEATFGTRQD